jgi:hypothetical protein
MLIAQSFITSFQLIPVSSSRNTTALNWRHAARRLDPTRRILLENWTMLETALILSPSSSRIAAAEIYVISDQKARRKLFPAARNQVPPEQMIHIV